MKIAYRLFLCLLISVFLFGCSEQKAGIEGKLLDGRGQPMPGITIIFKQVQAAKGYEQLETKTLANGVFRIDGVMPVSEYVIIPVSDNWKTKVTTKITTLTDGQTLILSNPIIIRFNALKDGTVADTKTGMQWLMLGITDINSSNILNAVKNIKEGGFTDWRLPTKAELLQLEETPAAPGTQSETALSQKTCCVWVAELNSENVEWKFYVDDGNDVWASSKVPPDDRIVVVRNYMPTDVTPTAPVAQTPTASATPAAPPTNTPAVVATPAGRTATPSANLPAKSPATAAQSVVVPPVTTSPAQQSPSARVNTPAQRDSSISDSVTIQFAMSKSIINPEELSKLKGFYAKIKGKNGKIVIEGNSDSDGDASDNFRISGERALSVKAMLHKLELSKKLDMKIVGLSDTKPIADSATEAGRKLNRRADIIFIPESSATTSSPTKQTPSAKSLPAAPPVVAAPAKQAPSAKSLPAAPPVVAAPTKQAPSAKSLPAAAPVVAVPTRQAPSESVTTPAVVKSEDGVLRASRKACIAKKAQPAK